MKQGIYEVNTAMCPEEWRLISALPNLAQRRGFVHYYEVSADGRREKIAEGQSDHLKGRDAA